MARNGLRVFHMFGNGLGCLAVGFSQRPTGPSRRPQLSAGRRAPSPVGELMALQLPHLLASVRSPCSTAPGSLSLRFIGFKV